MFFFIPEQFVTHVVHFRLHFSCRYKIFDSIFIFHHSSNCIAHTQNNSVMNWFVSYLCNVHIIYYMIMMKTNVCVAPKQIRVTTYINKSEKRNRKTNVRKMKLRHQKLHSENANCVTCGISLLIRCAQNYTLANRPKLSTYIASIFFLVSGWTGNMKRLNNAQDCPTNKWMNKKQSTRDEM